MKGNSETIHAQTRQRIPEHIWQWTFWSVPIISAGGILIINSVTNVNFKLETALAIFSIPLLVTVFYRIGHIVSLISKQVAQVDDIHRKMTEVHLQPSGITKAHNEIPVDAIKEAFRTARQHIRILETWCPGRQLFTSAIKDALKYNCSVELLFLNPKCPQADARNKDLRIKEGQVKSEIETSINGLYDEIKEYYGTEPDSKVQIKLYEGTPTMAVYASDEHFFLAFYPRDDDSVKSPHLEIQGRQTWFGRMVSNHFQSIWSTAAAYQPELPNERPKSERAPSGSS